MDIPHHKLWRQDMAEVPAAPRRAARYALQLLVGDPILRGCLHDKDVLQALWHLSQPLLVPQALGPLLAPCIVAYQGTDERDEDRGFDVVAPPSGPFVLVDSDDWNHETGSYYLRTLHLEGLKPGLRYDGDQVGRIIRSFFEGLPDWVVPRLAEADGDAPASPAVALLGGLLQLDQAELSVLDYLERRAQSLMLNQLVRAAKHEYSRQPIKQTQYTRLARMLGVGEQATRRALSRRAPLRTLRLIEHSSEDQPDLDDILAPSGLLLEILESAPGDLEALLALLIEPAPGGTWQLVAFPHLAEPARRVRAVLRRAATTGTAGINALFYGPPGVGKTELARALAADGGLRAYQVRSTDDDGEGLEREGRLSAYLLAQRLLANRQDALLIFDEIEDVFASSDEPMRWLLGRQVPGHQKGWMNRILEENPVPAIWITNSTDGLDPAFLRRFLLPLAMKIPPRSVRRQMAEHHLGACGLAPDLLDELAADTALAPAQLGAARRLIELHPEAPAEATVRAGIAAMRVLLHGAPMAPRRVSATAFDVAYLNLGGGVTPSALVQALARQGRGSLLFYGPPGTGKTVFAEVLAEALDRELVARQASDLLSPYVGETEQNLARLFGEIDPTSTVLLLDEVDSFLADRRQARHSWERVQVNELLQQMERFPGIFVAATNRMGGLDAAALRRFDFKLHFRALTEEQRLRLFAREALGDADAPVPPAIARHLAGMEGLTAGDFATVARQRRLLGEALMPEQFLKRLVAEWRLKERHEENVGVA